MGSPVRVIYVSYDGALDPLGASQVVPYLLGLAEGGVAVTLVSFEKPATWAQMQTRDTLRHRLEGHGIRWRPLRYHKRPRLAGTLRDIIAGCRAITREASRFGPTLVHCRGDIATIMARWAHLPKPAAFSTTCEGFLPMSESRAALGDGEASLIGRSGGWRPRILSVQMVRSSSRATLRRSCGGVAPRFRRFG